MCQEEIFSGCSAPPVPPLRMEVEVKLRLPSREAHQALSDALRPFHLRTHLQENLFFDTPGGDLFSRLSGLRLRFYESDSRCVLSLKSLPILSSGITRVEEDEEDLDPPTGRLCAAHPQSHFPSLPSRIARRVAEEFAVDLAELRCLGGFRNVRAVYGWVEDLTLEVDETRFDFGTAYEIECETNQPERARELLEGFLKERCIPYEYSQKSKFAVFRSGKLA